MVFPLDPLGPRNIPIDPIGSLRSPLKYFTNYQLVHQLWRLILWDSSDLPIDPLGPSSRPTWPPGTPLTYTLTPWDNMDVPLTPWDTPDVPLDPKQIKTLNVAWGMQSFAQFTPDLVSRKSCHLGTGIYPF